MKISSNYILDEVINYLRKKKKTNAGVLYVYSDFIVTSENHSLYIYIYMFTKLFNCTN